MMDAKRRRVGVVGYGKLGEFLVKQILGDSNFELAFVWNRSKDILVGKVDEKYVIDDLKTCSSRNPDIIIEVAHPCISKEYGSFFLQVRFQIKNDFFCWYYNFWFFMIENSFFLPIIFVM